MTSRRLIPTSLKFHTFKYVITIFSQAPLAYRKHTFLAV